MAPKALKFKGSDTLPTKKAIFELYINQQLSIATGFVATSSGLRGASILAYHFLCISEVFSCPNAKKNDKEVMPERAWTSVDESGCVLR